MITIGYLFSIFILFFIAVYIAWRNNSNDQFVLMIDDVLIDPPAAATYDVAMSDTTNEYTIVPLSQVTPLGASGEITEMGGQAVTNATMNVTVYDGAMDRPHAPCMTCDHGARSP